MYEPVKVAILSTGTELCTIGQPLSEGKIYNNIAYLLAAAMQKQGVQISFMETCADEESLLAQKIQDALEVSDLLITTGAVSVGKKGYCTCRIRADRSADPVPPGEYTAGNTYDSQCISGQADFESVR